MRAVGSAWRRRRRTSERRRRIIYGKEPVKDRSLSRN
jgi:hypothetical protein